MKCRGIPAVVAFALLAGCATQGRVVQPGLVDGWYRVARVIDTDTNVSVCVYPALDGPFRARRPTLPTQGGPWLCPGPFLARMFANTVTHL